MRSTTITWVSTDEGYPRQEGRYWCSTLIAPWSEQRVFGYTICYFAFQGENLDPKLEGETNCFCAPDPHNEHEWACMRDVQFWAAPPEPFDLKTYEKKKEKNYDTNQKSVL